MTDLFITDSEVGLWKLLQAFWSRLRKPYSMVIGRLIITFQENPYAATDNLNGLKVKSSDLVRVFTVVRRYFEFWQLNNKTEKNQEHSAHIQKVLI